jgi:hypothetical protein
LPEAENPKAAPNFMPDRAEVKTPAANADIRLLGMSRFVSCCKLPRDGSGFPTLCKEGLSGERSFKHANQIRAPQGTVRPVD